LTSIKKGQWLATILRRVYCISHEPFLLQQMLPQQSIVVD